eukprot:scpid27005/ scgid1101/ LIM/homeobox protein Lhx9
MAKKPSSMSSYLTTGSNAESGSKDSQQPTCTGCGKRIGDRYLLRAGDQEWHDTCMVCCVCGSPLRGLTAYCRSGKLFCDKDYERLSRKCGAPGCGGPLLPGEEVRVMGTRLLHSSCCVCTGCGRPLGSHDLYQFTATGHLLCDRQHGHGQVQEDFIDLLGLATDEDFCGVVDDKGNLKPEDFDPDEMLYTTGEGDVSGLFDFSLSPMEAHDSLKSSLSQARESGGNADEGMHGILEKQEQLQLTLSTSQSPVKGLCNSPTVPYVTEGIPPYGAAATGRTSTVVPSRKSGFDLSPCLTDTADLMSPFPRGTSHTESGTESRPTSAASISRRQSVSSSQSMSLATPMDDCSTDLGQDLDLELSLSEPCESLKEEPLDPAQPPKKRPRGPRTKITEKQLRLLKTAYDENRHPSSQVQERLQEDTLLTRNVIKVWFQNRRSTEKRHEKKLLEATQSDSTAAELKDSSDALDLQAKGSSPQDAGQRPRKRNRRKRDLEAANSAVSSTTNNLELGSVTVSQASPGLDSSASVGGRPVTTTSASSATTVVLAAASTYTGGAAAASHIKAIANISTLSDTAEAANTAKAASETTATLNTEAASVL